MSTTYIFYAYDGISFSNLRFENDVKMYGTQTFELPEHIDTLFENDVKMYSTQTIISTRALRAWFENDVKMYGVQTGYIKNSFLSSLCPDIVNRAEKKIIEIFYVLCAIIKIL